MTGFSLVFCDTGHPDAETHYCGGVGIEPPCRPMTQITPTLGLLSRPTVYRTGDGIRGGGVA